MISDSLKHFRYWQRHRHGKRAICPRLVVEIQRVFHLSQGSAGARTLAQLVTKSGIPLSRYLASKAMNTLNLVSKQPPKLKNKNRGRKHGLADNVLDRQFNVATPNTVWCTDVTHLRTGGEWRYLAVVIDLYARKTVG
ncbi:DDE-type integrase/transposase/recombinase [Zooshikella ganghwensis]|uniref:Integrase catalytic domain-containing protein n=1 Tax=Zooshikella ganghwensis TaxID=202772 RepID=A0A4P9VM57_9GAMM|nr:DDE-type integrase/transposase/recombinase [Zooshikella ganghwensis]RDH43190.1 hypothetical protein B9G39_06900 [Zooshikella ganghwensis]